MPTLTERVMRVGERLDRIDEYLREHPDVVGRVRSHVAGARREQESILAELSEERVDG